MLMGCASLTPQSPDAMTPPANLRQPCPDLVSPADGTGGTLLRWSIDTARVYRECQNRARELVEAWPR
jgi:hypothetical protein